MTKDGHINGPIAVADLRLDESFETVYDVDENASAEDAHHSTSGPRIADRLLAGGYRLETAEVMIQQPPCDRQSERTARSGHHLAHVGRRQVLVFGRQRRVCFVPQFPIAPRIQ